MTLRARYYAITAVEEEPPGFIIFSVSFQQLFVQRLQLLTDEVCVASNKTRTFLNTSEILDTRTVSSKL
jgi:hypothetical protein